ncbi:MAG TPA: hypothetical protein VND64_04240 [Pirellulales bacterium]|nr:hypothetical protein [Pirellulales bacterium]
MNTGFGSSRRFLWPCIVTLLALAYNAAQGDEIIDRIKPLAGTTQYVAFCGEGGGVGHAFVLFGSHDEEKKICRTDLAVGFWPDAQSKVERLTAAFGEVEGVLRDEMKRQDLSAGAACRLTVEVTAEQMKLLKILAEAYKAEKYRLNSTDCVTFVSHAAAAIDLKVPDRDKLFAEWKEQLKKEVKKDVTERQALDTFPEFFVRRLSDSNGGPRGAAK